jgi:hypothetical protein
MPKISKAAKEFYDETLPTLSDDLTRQWLDKFHKKAQECSSLSAQQCNPFDELVQKTSRDFARYVLQECWQFFVESQIKDKIKKDIDEAWLDHARWLKQLSDGLPPAIYESDVSPALRAAAMRKRPAGRPLSALDNVSSASLLAWALIQRARVETSKSRWKLFARILYALFPDDFIDANEESLRRRVREFERRHTAVESLTEKQLIEEEQHIAQRIATEEKQRIAAEYKWLSLEELKEAQIADKETLK